MTPFRLQVPQAHLDDLAERIGVRGAQVDDQVRLVEESRSDVGMRLARHRLLEGSDRDGAISTGTAESPLAEKTIIMSAGLNRKFERITSARPGVRSMNIACRWPFAPTTWVWKVIDSSTMGLKPG